MRNGVRMSKALMLDGIMGSKMGVIEAKAGIISQIRYEGEALSIAINVKEAKRLKEWLEGV